MDITAAAPLRGEILVPGDKSITHRAIMFGALAEGTTHISHALTGADCLSTIGCFQKLGIRIGGDPASGSFTVCGRGLYGLSAPDAVLDCGNSGTTTRLISGILAAQPFVSTLTGDASIRKRPMRRIMEPLSQMGARIESLAGNGCAPLRITGSPLHGITYQSPVASAQVKSAVLLAGLYAEGETAVIEPALSRDHTERMLRSFGAELISEEAVVSGAAAVSGMAVAPGTTAAVSSAAAVSDTTAARPIARIRPDARLIAQDITVPGDISSAAYFLAAAALVPGSELLLRNVGINPTRDGMLRVMRDMGADLTILNTREIGGEPVADLLIRSSSLHAVTIEGSLIPTLIDEIPALAVLAACADGTTIIRDAAELKVKESDRIHTVADNLTRMGADVTETADGMIIRGGRPLHGAVIDSCHDHRIAMSFAVAALIAGGTTTIRGAECVDISYPTFWEDLRRIQR